MTDDELHAVLRDVFRAIHSEDVPGESLEAGGWMMVDSGVGLPTLNFAVVASPDAVTSMDVPEQWFDERAGFRLLLRIPGDEAVLAMAESRGYTMTRSQPVMARALPLDALPMPDGFALREARERAQILDYLSVRKANRPERPSDDDEAAFIEKMVSTGRLRYFVAYREGTPVATASSALAGKAVSISNVWVDESVRRQGLGAAMTAAAAIHEGAEWALLEASAMGEPVYRRMGFRPRFRYLQFAPPQPEAETN
ncbi:MAG: GNAT family N-acetyltransferase [bacterium]